MQYVIIGNSTAAIGCVEGIRSVDAEGRIVLLSREPHHTYGRPLISYLLCGRTDEQRMKYRPDGFYSDNGVEFHPGVTVTAIDAQDKCVVCEGGETFPYDRLLVATGSDPIVPPVPGLTDVPECFTFMSLDDARALQAALTPEKRVLIVGAGLIGLKCMEGIYGQCASITLVDRAPQILPSILDESAARRVQTYIEGKGVQFILGDSAASFEPRCAVLESGRRVEFDILVMAVGVRPNTALVKSIGGACERGLLVDKHMQTSVPDVYAAGDCVQSDDITTGANRVLAILPNAYRQGHVAGQCMAGADARFGEAFPQNSIGFFDLHTVTAGAYTGECVEFDTPDTLKKLFVQDGLLKGYMIIGDVRRAGIYTALIREQTPLSEIDFDLIADKPQLMAFAYTERKKKLGGVPK